MERKSGILMHITSLPGSQGCGTIGREAFEFVDLLKNAKQRYWQILPTCPPDETGSPYHSCSARAGSHLLIDLFPLIESGYLSEKDVSALAGGNAEKVNYDFLTKEKDVLLRKAYLSSRSQLSGALYEFYNNEISWLADYALFMALHNEFGNIPWFEWEYDIKKRNENALNYWRDRLKDEIGFYVFAQFLFFTQWQKLKEYANSNGVLIIGDLPIYVSDDSADVWSNQIFFDLDEECRPNLLSGCPPDAFSDEGQLWNNPLYRWDILQQHHYSWWIDRLRAGLRLYDMLRLDHFRGFDAYWAVDKGSKIAKNGRWLPGPGMDLFRAVCWQMGLVPIIAEDLGVYTDSLKQLLNESGFPGMRVLEFAFDYNYSNPFLPHNYIENCVAYTGTHDNNTVLGWEKEQDCNKLNFVREYLGISAEQNLADAFIRAVWASKANLAIAPIQDFLCLDESARMNTPSTISSNWSWRVDKKRLNDKLTKKIRTLTVMYSRD